MLTFDYSRIRQMSTNLSTKTRPVWAAENKPQTVDGVTFVAHKIVGETIVVPSKVKLLKRHARLQIRPEANVLRTIAAPRLVK